MRFLFNRILRRYTWIGRTADLLLLVGAGLRFGHRRGWVSDDLMRSVGLDKAVEAKQLEERNLGSSSAGGIGSAALAAGALWRMLRRRRSRR